MWTCPVCQKEYDDEQYICPKCQFDERKNCTSLVSLVPLSEAQLAALERMWKLPEPEAEPEHVKPVINIGGLWEQASFNTSGFLDVPATTPFQIQENAWFELPMQKKLWYDFIEGTARIDWGYLHQYPLQFFKAYGKYAPSYMSEYTVKGLKGILKESAVSEQQVMTGGERLYNDLMFMYCSNISDIKVFTEVKKLFSKKCHDGYDQYRAVMLGIFLWRNSSEVRQANAFKAA